MDCYLCDNEAFQSCPRCGNPYCRDHGEDPSAGPGQALCADCLNPVNAAPSGAFFRASLLALLLGSVLALWLLVRPPGLPGESTEVVIPEASPQATATPTPSPSHQPAANPARYMMPYQRTASGPSENAIGSKFGWTSTLESYSSERREAHGVQPQEPFDHARR